MPAKQKTSRLKGPSAGSTRAMSAQSLRTMSHSAPMASLTKTMGMPMWMKM